MINSKISFKRKLRLTAVSCVYLQLASKNVGCILMFLGMLVFRPLGLGIHHVSWISAAFPLLGLIGLCFVKESPLFDAR